MTKSTSIPLVFKIADWPQADTSAWEALFTEGDIFDGQGPCVRWSKGIRDILGHATLAMAEKHYNRATGISSCSKLQSIVEDICADVPKMVLANRRPMSSSARPHKRRP